MRLLWQMRSFGHVGVLSGSFRCAASERIGGGGIEDTGPGVLEQPLITWPPPASAGSWRRFVTTEKDPALPVDQLPADPELVLVRGLALEVRRISAEITAPMDQV